MLLGILTTAKATEIRFVARCLLSQDKTQTASTQVKSSENWLKKNRPEFVCST
jgi:hypothetical protein